MPIETRARRATPEEETQRNRLTAPVWGDRLSLDEYLAREKRLAATAFAREGLRTWVLERDDGEIVASHESYRMNTARGHAEGIASVFVEPKYRGSGFATTLLSASLATFRAEKADASILYSEVGAKIYQAIGYVPRPIRARQWTPVSKPLIDVDAKGRPKYDVAEPFERGDAQLPDPAESGDTKAAFRVLLTRTQLDWHHERAAFYHSTLAAGRRNPDSLLGARAGKAWVEWFPDYRLERLFTLAVKPGTPEENERLVEATRRAAWLLGLPVAEHWVSPSIDLPGGSNISRDDEIPMIAMFADGLSAEDWNDFGRGCWI